jgi:hypothetical protein
MNFATKPSSFSFGVMSEHGVPELVQRRDGGGSEASEASENSISGCR